MMKINKSHLIYIILCIVQLLGFLSTAVAQEVRVIPEIEPSAISIGEQAQLKVRIIYPAGSRAEIALPADTLVTGVEILSTSVLDSTVVNDKLREITYGVLLTSFDSATYRLNNIQALVDGTLIGAENPPSLIVNTIPVDLEHPDQYSDIKGQWKPAFVWTDYLLYLYILLGLIALGLLLYFLLRRMKRTKKKKPEKPIIVLDPYEEAITGMKQLKAEELWEKNQVKEYYTRMTDILRHYLWRVYGMETAEKTSTEILDEFNGLVGKDRMYIELKKILQTADLAKFAKYRASSDENVSLMSAAVAFIEENKPQPKSTTEVDTDINRKEGSV